MSNTKVGGMNESTGMPSAVAAGGGHLVGGGTAGVGDLVGLGLTCRVCRGRGSLHLVEEGRPIVQPCICIPARSAA